MPELPEVETIARALQSGGRDAPPIAGLVITSVALLWYRTLAYPTPAEFATRLPGQTILSVGRRGKLVVFTLSQDVLLIHLRMSGDLRVWPTGESDCLLTPPGPHERAIFCLHPDYSLEDGLRLVFDDVRKFGRIWLAERPEDVTGLLGPEPFDEALTPLVFHSMLAGRARQLKPLLLDQTFLAGLGNIYTDEALHLARLHPASRADQLDAAQATRLLAAIRTVLQAGIAAHGASIDWIYRGGEFQNQLAVYRRTNLPCRTCGTLIQRILIGQRSTHLCPVCQPAPPGWRPQPGSTPTPEEGRL